MADLSELFRKIAAPATRGPVSRIIAGLGNPGDRYANTRHNVGFVAADALAAQAGATINRAGFSALYTEIQLGGERVLLLKPQTYMNASGEAVAAAARFYKLTPDRILVICDDISFAPGCLRIRRQGSAGGHNGLKSIISCLGSEGFARFKIGVGQKPHPDYDLADWVLGTFPASDAAAVRALMPDVCAAAQLWAQGEMDRAMSAYSH